MGEARIRQVLVGMELTLFAGVLAVSLPGIGLVSAVLAVIGLIMSAIEPKAPTPTA